MIVDSGNRRKFDTGAVRDIEEGKGRCDLLPLDVASALFNKSGDVLMNCMQNYMQDKDAEHLVIALRWLTIKVFNGCVPTMLLEVSKHFEEGAVKYGENNWRQGIPVHCYIDSAIRHYLKYLRGDDDERHDRAVAWNLMCAIWTIQNKPEMNDIL